MKSYVVDTHSLIWFITDDPKLSKQANRILEQAENAETGVLIPTIVLAEVTYIAQKKKVEVTIEEVLERIQEGDGFTIVPFDFVLFKVMFNLPNNWEIHDRIIAATAQYYKAPFITKDKDLIYSEDVKTIW